MSHILFYRGSVSSVYIYVLTLVSPSILTDRPALSRDCTVRHDFLPRVELRLYCIHVQVDRTKRYGIYADTFAT